MADSNDLLRRIARVGADIDPALSDRDVERLVEGARRRRQRRTVTRVGAGTLAAGIATLAVAVVLHERRPTPPAPADVAVAVAPAPAAAPAAARDGAVAAGRRVGGDTARRGERASVREDAPQRVAIDLVRGRGRFDVAPRPERPFSVRAGDVTITVLGTVFTVERVADRIGVSVARGRVLVDWGVGSRRLDAGESGWFPPLVVGQPAAPASEPAPAPAASRSRARVRGRGRARRRRAVRRGGRRLQPSRAPDEAAPLPNPLPARGQGQALRGARGPDLISLSRLRERVGVRASRPRHRALSPLRGARGSERVAGAGRAVQPDRAEPPETAETLLAAADAARLQGRAAGGRGAAAPDRSTSPRGSAGAAGRVHARARVADGARAAAAGGGGVRRGAGARAPRAVRRGCAGARGGGVGKGGRRRQGAGARPGLSACLPERPPRSRGARARRRRVSG